MEKKNFNSNYGTKEISYCFLFYDIRILEDESIIGNMKCGFYTLPKMDLERAKAKISSKLNANILMCGYGGREGLPKGFNCLPEYKFE